MSALAEVNLLQLVGLVKGIYIAEVLSTAQQMVNVKCQKDSVTDRLGTAQCC